MDKLQLLSVLFILLGGVLIMDIHLNIPKISFRGKTRELSQKIEQIQLSSRKRKGTETANDYVSRIDGRTKESFVGRSYREAKNVYESIGQSDRYQRTLELSLIAGVAGGIAGLLLQNLLLAAVLAVGFYFLPLWLSRFSLFRYQRFRRVLQRS